MTRALVVLAMLATGCTASGPAAPVGPATPKEVVSAARATVEQWRQGWEVKSIETLAKLYEHDLDVVLITEGAALTGWKSIEAQLKDRLARASSVHVQLKDVVVSAQSDTVASVVATMRREVTEGASTTTETGTLTLVLRREHDGWLISLEHYSYRRPS